MKKRAVITGMGVVSSTGTGLLEFWNNVKGGVSGISVVERFDISRYSTKVAAEMKDFDPFNYIERKEVKRMDKFTQYAMIASQMAVEDSKIDLDSIDKDRFGVIIGSGIGGIATLEDQQSVLLNRGPQRVSPFFIPMMIANMAAGKIAINYGARGFNECVVTACASGANAIGDAFKVIERGDADLVICGGAEAPITPLSFAGFCSMKAMSSNPDPKTASRPFDKERDGFVMGEGAGILLIESLEHAKKRGADILAEIAGYSCTCDAYDYVQPAPGGEGAARAMALAIKDAGLRPQDIDYINAHGTSTYYNDKGETSAIKNVFKEHALKLHVSSTKSVTGHLLGAAGAIEGIISVMAIKEGFLPPTINYATPDPECDLSYIPNRGIKRDVDVVLSNSLGFGGHNATLIFKKYRPVT